MTLQSGSERDVLVLAKTIAANEFPVERPGVIAQDRASGALLRLAPFPWKGADTDPPVQRWAWLQLGASRDERDPRPETHTVQGEILPTGYVDAKDGWRLRWPFVRPHLRGSVEALVELSRARATTMGFVRPQPDIDIVQLPLRLRFRCASYDCDTMHELPVLDWELHSLAQATRAKYGPSWATKFRETWGGPLAERYDVHLLLSAYAQAPTKLYVAGLFYPPKVAEDAHEHVHHVEHRRHASGDAGFRRADAPSRNLGAQASELMQSPLFLAIRSEAGAYLKRPIKTRKPLAFTPSEQPAMPSSKPGRSRLPEAARWGARGEARVTA